MAEEHDFNKEKQEEGMGNLDSKDIFSDFNVSDENTSDIFDAIMTSDIPDEDASAENGVEDAILTSTGTAGLDDDPFGDSLFAETPQATAGIDSENPFAELENEKTATSVDYGNPFAYMNNDGNPFADMEKAGKSKDSLASNDDSVFGDSSSPFASTKQGDDQENTSIDDFLKSIS